MDDAKVQPDLAAQSKRDNPVGSEIDLIWRIKRRVVV